MEVKKLKLQIGENEYIFGDFALKSELDEFDTQAYKEGVNAFIAEAKKEVVTLGQLDEFDTQAYKGELNAIADEVKNKMAVFDGLSELDLNELKAELKAQLKTEIKAEILAELRGGYQHDKKDAF